VDEIFGGQPGICFWRSSWQSRFVAAEGSKDLPIEVKWDILEKSGS